MKRPKPYFLFVALFYAAAFTCFLSDLAESIQAQQSSPVSGDRRAGAPDAKSKSSRGVIRGRVVDDGGQLVPFLDVRLLRSGASLPQSAPLAKTDEGGRFEFTDLSPGIYSASVGAPGYYQTGSRPLLIGDEVTLTLAKGGVITGIVRDAASEPLPGMPVYAVLVRDGEGRSVRQIMSGNRWTDDRGIYRIFGLRPGVYYVVAGARGIPGLLTGEAQTFYPSSARDTAAEVVVSQGQETSGIDITLRGGRGHTISGAFGNLPDDLERISIGLNLMHAATGAGELAPGVNLPTPGGKFELRDIEDGDYILRAIIPQRTPNATAYASEPVRVKVRGADVTGLRLNVTPLGAIAGRVVLEKAPVANPKAKCEGRRDAYLEEVAVGVARDPKDDPPEYAWLNSRFSVTLDDKGTFVVNGLSGGRFRFQTSLPSEAWYLKDVSLGTAARGRQGTSRSDQSDDVVTQGVLLREGGRIEGLTLTVAEGAASLSGKVVAVEGEKLPSRLRVYLVPTEKERADDVLRFAQTTVQSDGAFAFANLAPGRYWLVIKAMPTEEMSIAEPRPLYWEAAGRLALRKEAEAENNAVGLQSCQQVKDFSLRHKTRNASVKAVGSGK